MLGGREPTSTVGSFQRDDEKGGPQSGADPAVQDILELDSQEFKAKARPRDSDDDASCPHHGDDQRLLQLFSVGDEQRRGVVKAPWSSEQKLGELATEVHRGGYTASPRIPEASDAAARDRDQYDAGRR